MDFLGKDLYSLTFFIPLRYWDILDFGLACRGMGEGEFSVCLLLHASFHPPPNRFFFSLQGGGHLEKEGLYRFYLQKNLHETPFLFSPPFSSTVSFFSDCFTLIPLTSSGFV